jgi:hypothetical protein
MASGFGADARCATIDIVVRGTWEGAALEDTNPTQDSILRRLKDKADEIQSGVSEKIAAVSGAGTEMFKDRIAELNEIVPLIGELGYCVENVGIGIGLMPEVTMAISGLTKTMPEATYNRVIAKESEKPLLVSVIKGLQTASALQDKIHILGMRADTATITLGLTPKITLEFKKD